MTRAVVYDDERQSVELCSDWPTISLALERTTEIDSLSSHQAIVRVLQVGICNTVGIELGRRATASLALTLTRARAPRSSYRSFRISS